MPSSPKPLRPSPARLQQQRLFAWTLLACVVLCGAMAVPYYLGRIYTSDDLWAFHFPLRHFYAECLAAGEPFDWMPHLYGGFYLSGEGQAGTYHPLHLLLYKYLPLHAAFDLELLASYPLMLAGMYLFLRRNVGRRDAALLGAMVFTFSGFNLLHFVHPNAIAIVAHIPWLLLAIDVMLRSSGRWVIAAQVAVALLTASQLLLGYPQYVWFSLLAEGAYALYVWRDGWLGSSREERAASPQGPATGGSPLVPRGSTPATPRPATLVVLAGFKLLGLIIAGIQLLPTIDVLTESERQLVDADFVHHGALHPLNLLQFIGPYLFQSRVVGGNTQEFGLYIGAMPLVLLAWLLIRCKHLRGNRRFAAAAAVFAVIALVLALGRHGGLYYLQTYLPVVGKFRLPARYLVLVHLAMAALTAVAFADLARYALRKRRRSPELRPLRRLAVASLVLALVAGWLWAPHVAWLPLRLVGPMLVAVAAWLVWQVRERPQFALVAIVVFTAVDLGVYGFSYAIYPNTFDPATALSSVPDPPELAGATIATELRDPARHPLRAGNQMILKGWRQIDGYAGLEPARVLDYRNVTSLRAAGVHLVSRQESTEEIDGLSSHSDRWLEVPDPLPRANCVPGARVSHDPRNEIRQIPLERFALVDRPTDLDKSSADNAAGQVRMVADRPGTISVETNAPSRQLLVVNERFHHGWRAHVDGQTQPVLRANGEFLAVVVGPGSQRVDLTFEPASLRYGKWLSVIGSTLLAACTLTQLLRRRSRR